jgi:hypothetical protein
MSEIIPNTTVTEEVKQQITPDVPDYSQEEIAYLSGLQIRLERACDARMTKTSMDTLIDDGCELE